MVSMDYQRGYEAAYAEIYAAVDSEDHPANCRECRACGVIRQVIESTFMELGGGYPRRTSKRCRRWSGV